MNFEVKVDVQPRAFIKKAEILLANRIRERLRLLEELPFRYLEHYEGDHYKLRIGDYRALVDVDTTRKIVFVRVLDHRSRVYKRK